MLDRRRFLELGAATTAVAAAGCAIPTASPAYTDWIPAGDGSVLTAYADFTIAEQTSAIDPILPLFLPASDESGAAEVVPDFSALDRIEDPLLQLPLQTGGRVVVVSNLALGASGLGYLVDPDTPTKGVTELLRVNDTTIGTGDIDVERADAALRAGSDDFLGTIPYEVVGEGDDFTRYESTGDANMAAAVGESAVVTAESRRQLETAIDTWTGNHGRAVDANDTFRRLHDTVQSPDVLVGWVGPVDLQDYYFGDTEPDPATDVVSPRRDVLSAISFAPDSSEVTARLALHDADVDADELASRLGLSDATGRVSVDGNRMTASSTYTNDALDLEFVEPTATDEERTPSRDGDLPEPVAKAVPPNAFEFVYNEDENTVRVNFVEAVDAEEVTVRAVESEWETSTSTPGSVSYLTVYVDAGGDEVVVTVTVDGVTATVAREEFGR